MKRIIVLGGIAAALGTAPATAQEIGIDAAFNSHYVWRGLTYTNKFVIQPDAWASFGAGAATITVGGWGNVEMGEYNDTDDISENGSRGAGLTEFDWWGEVAVPLGIATITGGATGYVYPGDDTEPGLNSSSNTIEIYGKADLGIMLNPSFAIWYDVDKIKGAYMEFGVSHGIPLGATELTLGALAGVSAGQAQDSDPSENFKDDGLTHFDFSAEASFGAGPVSITPMVHMIWGQDSWTKFTTPTDKSDVKFWFGASIGWSKAFGGGEE